MPEIWYISKGSNRRYFSDIYIPKENLIIEVKSQWTYDGISGALEINLLKKQACIDAGFKYLLMLYNSTGTKLLTDIKW